MTQAEIEDKSSVNGPTHRAWWATVAVFLVVSLVAGATVAGPGLSWDEPAYRHSQVTLQNWFRLLQRSEDWGPLFSADAIYRFWQFNRFGHNFHPPMASYCNLATWSVMHHWWDDISSRRLASALQLAASAAMLCQFIGSRLGWRAGLFSALCLAAMPRLLGHAHVIGTDMPLMFFWAATALAFYRGTQSRYWQWATAALWGCLFLVKFSGAVIAAPIGVWLAVALVRQAKWMEWKRWLLWSVVIFVPLAPLAATLLFGAREQPPPNVLSSAIAFGLEHSHLTALLFLWPLVCLLFYYWRSRRATTGESSVGWEMPWVAIAVTPLVCIALNPSWWHDPVRSLAAYFDLNLNRQGHLPDIGIFYLGQRYLYSLPPLNAFVLMAVTIPFGILLLGLVGMMRSLVQFREPLGWYLILQMLTLPVIRMLPTPAHDGVRLFLPTFFFWAALAGLGAVWLVDLLQRWHPKWSSVAWLLLAAIGPGLGLYQWVRIHPFELSYYNVGLKRAMDWGFEVTYWYDAVTPTVLEELNERLPENISIGFPDPLINPEVFYQLQELDRLRADIRLGDDPVTQADGATKQITWAWLLTHSSKATAFTRLLYACPPWYESGCDGVRLFSVVDPQAGKLAFAIHVLTVDHDGSSKLKPLKLNELAFRATPEQLREAVSLVVQHKAEVGSHLRGRHPNVTALVQRWLLPGGQLDPNLSIVLQTSPDALLTAADIVARRGDDVRKVLTNPGYLRPEQFGGYFDTPK